MMREKQQGNPEYSFLFGREHSAYYEWALYAARNGWSPEAADQQAASHFQQQQQHSAPKGSQPLTLEEEMQIQNLLTTLTRSKESIRVGKEWILSHCPNGVAVAGQLLKAVTLAGGFEQKLNVVYLLSDVLFNCAATAGSPGEALREAIDQKLLAILQEATIRYQPAEQEKVFKVIDLWKDRQVMDQATISQLKAGLTTPPPAAPAAQPSSSGRPSGSFKMHSITPFSSAGGGGGGASEPAPAKASRFSSGPEPPVVDLSIEQLPVGLLIDESLAEQRERGHEQPYLQKPYTPLSRNRLPKRLPANTRPTRSTDEALKRFDANQAPLPAAPDRHRSRSRSIDARRGGRDDRRDERREERRSSRPASRERDARRRSRSPPEQDRRREDREDRRRDSDDRRRRSQDRDTEDRRGARSPARRGRSRDRESPPRRSGDGDRDYDRRESREDRGSRQGQERPPGKDKDKDDFDAFRKRSSGHYHDTGRSGFGSGSGRDERDERR